MSVLRPCRVPSLLMGSGLQNSSVPVLSSKSLDLSPPVTVGTTERLSSTPFSQVVVTTRGRRGRGRRMNGLKGFGLPYSGPPTSVVHSKDPTSCCTSSPSSWIFPLDFSTPLHRTSSTSPVYLPNRHPNPVRDVTRRSRHTSPKRRNSTPHTRK